MSVPEPTTGVEIKKFSGLYTNSDESEGDSGNSRIQLNMSLFVPGEMNIRKGMRKLNFTDTQQG